MDKSVSAFGSVRGKLASLETLLLERAVPGGMIARADSARIRERHVEDSLRAIAAFRASDQLAYDLGSGAGLPGLPLAIALPRVRFVLAESRRARAAFLELAVERLGLSNVEVHAGKVEDLPPGADVATARALAPMPRAWELAEPLLTPGGRLVYFAGDGLEDPLGAAQTVVGDQGSAELIEGESLASRAPLVMMIRR